MLFIHSTIDLWNNLKAEVRNCKRISSFKKAVSANVQKVPAYYTSGNRKENILHTRLRHACSILNADLYQCGLSTDPSCICGHRFENSYHYFFECKLFEQQRQILLNSVNSFQPVNLQLLLNGKSSLNDNTNKQIF